MAAREGCFRRARAGARVLPCAQRSTVKGVRPAPPSDCKLTSESVSEPRKRIWQIGGPVRFFGGFFAGGPLSPSVCVRFVRRFARQRRATAPQLVVARTRPHPACGRHTLRRAALWRASLAHLSPPPPRVLGPEGARRLGAGLAAAALLAKGLRLGAGAGAARSRRVPPAAAFFCGRAPGRCATFLVPPPPNSAIGIAITMRCAGPNRGRGTCPSQCCNIAT